jgi:hypothetical protein
MTAARVPARHRATGRTATARPACLVSRAPEPVGQPARYRHDQDQGRRADQQGRAEQPVGQVQPGLDAGDPGHPDTLGQAEDHEVGQHGHAPAAQLPRQHVIAAPVRVAANRRRAGQRSAPGGAAADP